VLTRLASFHNTNQVSRRSLFTLGEHSVSFSRIQILCRYVIYGSSAIVGVDAGRWQASPDIQNIMFPSPLGSKRQ
jgi:hypothetical protein